MTEDLAARPISPYGVAKLAAERYCVASRASTTRSRLSSLRYFNVFGPRQSPFSQYAAVVPLFITAIAAGEPVRIEGDGEQSRDFTYVDNVVDATIRAADTAGVSGRIFNIAASSPVERQPAGRHDRPDPRQGGRAAQAPPRAGRHPRLVGGRKRRPRAARLRAVASDWRTGCARTVESSSVRNRSPLQVTAAEPIRILRVIARLNMGGPALHVAYLSAGLRDRGYETTLVAGGVSQGEESMAYAAEEAAVPVTALPHLHREISPVRDLLAIFRLARIMREQRGEPADRAGLGGVGVQDVRSLLADDPGEPEGGDQVVHRRDLAMQVQAGRSPAPRAPPLRRPSILRRRRRRRPRASSRSPAHAGRREIGDVERRSAHVQPGDHPENADGLGGGELHGAGYAPRNSIVRRSPSSSSDRGS